MFWLKISNHGRKAAYKLEVTILSAITVLCICCSFQCLTGCLNFQKKFCKIKWERYTSYEQGRRNIFPIFFFGGGGGRDGDWLTSERFKFVM